MLIEFKVGALIMDPNSGTPIVVLRSIKDQMILPIWVGVYEANAIALEIEKVVSQRPMTHDLLKNVIFQMNGQLKRIIITDIKENTFYANIEILKDGNEEVIIVDARPSDAIALALRFDCPIFVEQKVLEISKSSVMESETGFGNIETTDEWPDLIGEEDIK